MATDTSATAAQLFERVMAPLVLGGELRPVHAIGGRVGQELGGVPHPSQGGELAERVQRARIRQARRLLPIDDLGPPTTEEWLLAAALNDVLQAASPLFDAALRRSLAGRILEVALATIEAVPPPATVGGALSRHSWFGRVLDVVRTDTVVSFWVGKRTYLGVPPPSHLWAPELRRVRAVATARSLLTLSPLAVNHARLDEAVARFLVRTPLTDLTACTRAAPAFAWTESTLALLATNSGRVLCLRALASLPAAEVDRALGRATRKLLTADRVATAGPAIALLGDRAIAAAMSRGTESAEAPSEEASFARGLGAGVAVRNLEAGGNAWRDEERAALLSRLREPALAAAAREALASLEARAEPTGYTTDLRPGTTER